MVNLCSKYLSNSKPHMTTITIKKIHNEVGCLQKWCGINDVPFCGPSGNRLARFAYHGTSEKAGWGVLRTMFEKRGRREGGMTSSNRDGMTSQRIFYE